MWYETENGEDIRPSPMDETSSKVYTYFRKDFERVEAKGEPDTEEYYPAHYKWKELKLKKEEAALYMEVSGIINKVSEHGDALDDVYDALTELAEMIVEVTG